MALTITYRSVIDVVFDLPFHSGVCLGMQVAVIEFSRCILGWRDAQSTEFDSSTAHPVVIEMPEHNTGHMGATMRLGKRRTVFKTKDSLLSKFNNQSSCRNYK